MPTYISLSEASRRTGKSLQTLRYHVKKGTISAHKKTKKGYELDPAEVFRVFPPLQETSVNTSDGFQGGEVKKDFLVKKSEASEKVSLLEEKLKMAEQRIRDLQEDRDNWRRQANALLEYKPKKKRWWF